MRGVETKMKLTTLLRSCLLLAFVPGQSLGQVVLGEPDVYQASPGPGYFVQAADLDNDGNTDLISSSASGSGSSGISILWGTSSGFERPSNPTEATQITDINGTPIQIGYGSYGIKVSDINRDNKKDIIIGFSGSYYNSTSDGIIILVNQGGRHFTKKPYTLVTQGYFNGRSTPAQIDIADINNDGKVDILTNYYRGLGGSGFNGAVVAYLQDSSGDFGTVSNSAERIGIESYAGGNVSFFCSGDFDNDGIPDIVTSHNVVNGTGTSYLHGNGDGTFSRIGNFFSGIAEYTGVTANDINYDGNLDFVQAVGDGRLLIHYGNGNGTFQPERVVTVGGYPTVTTIKDVNKDGYLDILVPCVENFAIAFGSPSGNYTEIQNVVTSGIRNQSTLSFDVNGDRIPEIVSAGTDSQTGTTTSILLYSNQTNPLDTEPPVTTVALSGFEMTLSATDNLTGVWKTYYQINDGEVKEYTGSVTLPALDVNITYWSVDKAENQEEKHTLSLPQFNTYLTVTNVSGMVGQKKTLSARLRRTGSNIALPGQTITFKLGGNVIGSGTTNVNGTATLNLPLPETIGTFALTAEFVGDSLNAPSIGTGTLTTTFANTVVTVPNKTTQAGDTLNLTSTLKRVGDGAIVGKVLTFKIDGNIIGTAITNTNGVGTISYTAPLEVGTKTITAEYAGTEVYGSSIGTGTLTLTKAKTTLAVSSRSIRVNRSVNLTARLRRVSDLAFPTGKLVTLLVNGVVIGSALTDENGYINLPYVPTTTGSFTIEGRFDGDDIHDPATDTATLTVNP